MRVTALLSLVLLAALASPALAQPSGHSAPPNTHRDDTRDAEHARIANLTRSERELLAPHIARGPVALIEFRGEAELPAIHFATRVRAPAARIADVIANPGRYPSFMPALDEVAVTGRRQNMVSYHWTWQTAVFTLRGDNVLQVYPAPVGRSDRPYRIESRATGGDLGTGRLVWRVYPEGPNRSLLTLSARLDLREANYLTRQINRGQNSINRTINISLAYVMLQGTAKEAERRVGAPPENVPEPPLTRPAVDVQALANVLARGDLLLMDTTGDRLNQVTVVGRMGRDETRTREVMTDPREFGPALVPGSYARIVREDDENLDFEWGVNLPLIGTSGKMRLGEADDGTVSIDAIEGALEGGRWRFATETYPNGEAIVIGWADFDPADASWLIRAMVADDPPLGAGIAGGTSIMVVRGIRSRAWRVQEARAAAEAAAEGG
ncbi:MAG: SRPBCC family protein [Deltaproteobacteria bacterium]|nr:SRPBCC family protein [Deltaproteobacteria bacterium]